MKHTKEDYSIAVNYVKDVLKEKMEAYGGTHPMRWGILRNLDSLLDDALAGEFHNAKSHKVALELEESKVYKIEKRKRELSNIIENIVTSPRLKPIITLVEDLLEQHNVYSEASVLYKIRNSKSIEESKNLVKYISSSQSLYYILKGENFRELTSEYFLVESFTDDLCDSINYVETTQKEKDKLIKVVEEYVLLFNKGGNINE